jgi:hypothetical protein
MTMNPLCNCLSLRQATRRVTQLYDQALAPLDLRATQYSLLTQIDTLGPVAFNPLAETLVMDRATLGHNVRPLEARGLVRRAFVIASVVLGMSVLAAVATAGTPAGAIVMVMAWGPHSARCPSACRSGCSLRRPNSTKPAPR